MRDEKELLKQIEEYFENVTQEELEDALKRAGYGEIEPSSNSGYKML